MMNGGGTFMNAESAMNAQTKLEAAIEDLRIKYERINEQKERDAAKAAAEAKNRGLSKDQITARDEAAQETDWAVPDSDMEALRQSRIAALRQKAKDKVQQREAGHGELREIVEEDFLKEVTSTKYVAVHFFHDDFLSCRVLDKHLRILAARAPSVKFMRINAAKASFFVSKLRVKVLPTLVMFIDGIAVGRQTGFEGLQTTRNMDTVVVTSRSQPNSTANVEDFPTQKLYRRLEIAGLLGTEAQKLAIERSNGDDDDDEDEMYDDDDGSGSIRRAMKQMMREGDANGANSALSAAASTAAFHAARAARDASYYDINQ